MPSTTRAIPDPVSRVDTRPRGVFLAAALALACGLALFAGTPAGAQKAPCLPFCDATSADDSACCSTACLAAPCAAFVDCQTASRAAVTECVADECLGRGILGS